MLNGYFAGIVDGEGCISACYYKPKKHSMVIFTVTNTNLSLIKDIIKTYGGWYTISNRKSSYGKKTCYNWSPNTYNMGPILKKILPYLRVKRKQAKLAIKLRTCIDNKVAQHDVINLATRIKWIKKIKELNHA